MESNNSDISDAIVDTLAAIENYVIKGRITNVKQLEYLMSNGIDTLIDRYKAELISKHDLK